MLQTIRRTAPILALAFAAGLLATASPAQDDEKPKQDPLIEEALDQLQECLKDRKAEKDTKAINLLNTVRDRIGPKSHPKDLKMVVKDVGKVFSARPQRPAKMDALYRAAAETLGAAGEDGAKVLMKIYEHSAFSDPDYIPLRAHMLKEIGKGGAPDDRIANWLLDIAFRAPQDALLASAGGALQNFHKAKAKTQRDIVEKLINRWEGIDTDVRSGALPRDDGTIDLGRERGMEQLKALQGPWNKTLMKLTSQKISSVQEWRTWQNKNPRWEPKTSDK